MNTRLIIHVNYLWRGNKGRAFPIVGVIWQKSDEKEIFWNTIILQTKCEGYINGGELQRKLSANVKGDQKNQKNGNNKEYVDLKKSGMKIVAY